MSLCSIALLCRYSRHKSMQATKNSTKSHKRRVLTGLFLGELAVSANVVSEIATRHQVDYQIKVVLVFERVVHVD